MKYQASHTRPRPTLRRSAYDPCPNRPSHLLMVSETGIFATFRKVDKFWSTEASTPSHPGAHHCLSSVRTAIFDSFLVKIEGSFLRTLRVILGESYSDVSTLKILKYMFEPLHKIFIKFQLIKPREIV